MSADVATASGAVCRTPDGAAAAPIVDAGTVAIDGRVAARVRIWFLIYAGDADTVLRRHLRPTDPEMREKIRLVQLLHFRRNRDPIAYALTRWPD